MACLHDHSCEDHDCSSDWSLYRHIDLSKVSLFFSFDFSHQIETSFDFNDALSSNSKPIPYVVVVCKSHGGFCSLGLFVIVLHHA